MLLYFSLLKIKLIKIIKNGLTNSIGWNLGRKYKSIQRCALFTSTPIIGTKNNEIKDSKKINGEILNSFSSLIDDKTKIVNNPKKTNDKCLKKNSYSFVSYLSDTKSDVDTNEKNNPVINNKIIKEKMNLSIFFHQS